MYNTLSSSKSENKENFVRQGSLRKVIPPEHKVTFFDLHNEDLNKIYQVYRQEYIILAEYKMVQTENIQGVYVIPSKESSFLWFGVVFVRNGPFENGIFRFNVILDENFPDSEYPKIVFSSEIFHPVINPETNELNLLDAFPSWNKSEQHLWQVLKYIQWIFSNFESSLAHSVNKEAEEMYKQNKETFTSKAKEIVKFSQERLYDDPPTEDKHYITFLHYNNEEHDNLRNQMLNFNNCENVPKIGLSWVLPGSFKPLSRPPTPQSESEL